MRIAYLSNYQGPTLLKRRPIIRNRSMANRTKLELIASLLQEQSHQVEIISHGEVVQNVWTFYPSFCEPERFHPNIPVYYASALPVRRLNGLWSSLRMLHLFKSRHRATPYDLVIIWNMKGPQVACANYAMRRLRLPVVLEYEDDEFVDTRSEMANRSPNRRDRSRRGLLETVSGCIGVSPYLLTQVPDHTPRMLLRGVVGHDILQAGERPTAARRNWVLFSGTHGESNGVAQLIEAWRLTPIADWELHITGFGEMTDMLRRMAVTTPGVVFHGHVGRQELVKLMSSAKICINPHAVSKTPGNVFAFKIVEYLGAGAHCITTPMGTLEPDLEAGITYMPDNAPRAIAATLRQVIENRQYERLAARAAAETYGPAAVSRSLDSFLRQTLAGTATR